MVTDDPESIGNVINKIYIQYKSYYDNKNNPNIYICPENGCQLSMSEDALWSHFPLYHINSRNYSSKCPICTDNVSNIQVHIRNAHGPCDNSRNEIHSEFRTVTQKIYAFSLVIVRNPSNGK